MKKYELTDETKTWDGHTLHRIKALISFGYVDAGDLGGWVENERNLSHAGYAWVYGNARVYGNALVYGDACVYGNARVYGDACVYGNARVYGDACVYGEACVYGGTKLRDNAEVFQTQQYKFYGPCGSRNDITTFFRTRNREVGVACGCYHGETLEAFEARVHKEHGGDRYEGEYMDAIASARKYVRLDPAE